MCVKLGHAKFQSSSARGAFSKWRLNGGGRRNVPFSTENWPCLRNSERYSQSY